MLFAARQAGVKIVYLKMGFRDDLSDLGDTDSANRVRHLDFGVGQPCMAPDGRQGRLLIRDTWNTDVIEELRAQAQDVVLYKHRFSGFYETELDGILRRLGTKNLTVTGCTTSVCVDSTIRDEMFRDYRCVLLADCAGEPIGSEPPRSNHEASLLTIETLFGWVSDSERFVSALQAGRLGYQLQCRAVPTNALVITNHVREMSGKILVPVRYLSCRSFADNEEQPRAQMPGDGRDAQRCSLALTTANVSHLQVKIAADFVRAVEWAAFRPSYIQAPAKPERVRQGENGCSLRC